MKSAQFVKFFEATSGVEQRGPVGLNFQPMNDVESALSWPVNAQVWWVETPYKWRRMKPLTPRKECSSPHGLIKDQAKDKHIRKGAALWQVKPRREDSPYVFERHVNEWRKRPVKISPRLNAMKAWKWSRFVAQKINQRPLKLRSWRPQSSKVSAACLR